MCGPLPLGFCPCDPHGRPLLKGLMEELPLRFSLGECMLLGVPSDPNVKTCYNQ